MPLRDFLGEKARRETREHEDWKRRKFIRKFSSGFLLLWSDLYVLSVAVLVVLSLRSTPLVSCLITSSLSKNEQAGCKISEVLLNSKI